MTTGPAAGTGLAAVGYRVAGTLAASVTGDEGAEAMVPGRGSPGPVPGLRGQALEQLCLIAALSDAAGLCAVRFSAVRTDRGSVVTASGTALDVALPSWSVERPQVFATTLGGDDLAAMVRAGYRPRAVVTRELRRTRNTDQGAHGCVLPAPDRAIHVAWRELRDAVAAAGRRHRAELLLVGDPETAAEYLAGDGGPHRVTVGIRLVADVFRHDGAHPSPAGPEPRFRVSLRRPREPVDARVLADRVRR